MKALVDLVIAITFMEGAFLTWRHRVRGRGHPPSKILPNLASGLCLLVGLRLSLGGAAWPAIAGCLAGAGVAHLFDLRAR